MKKIIILITICVLNYCGFAQNQKKIDSLQSVLKSRISDQEKVETYNLLARQYSDSDSTQTYYYANQAIQIAKKINDYKSIVKSFDEIGWVSIQFGNFEKANQTYQDMIAISKKTSTLREKP